MDTQPVPTGEPPGSCTLYTQKLKPGTMSFVCTCSLPHLEPPRPDARKSSPQGRPRVRHISVRTTHTLCCMRCAATCNLPHPVPCNVAAGLSWCHEHASVRPCPGKAGRLGSALVDMRMLLYGPDRLAQRLRDNISNSSLTPLLSA